MPFRTTRRSIRGLRRNRSKVILARTHGGTQGLASAAIVNIDLLSQLESDYGILQPPPGTVIMGVRGMLALIYSAASGAGVLDKIVSYGLIVDRVSAPYTEHNPGSMLEMPWLDWGVLGISNGASVTAPILPGFGTGSSDWTGHLNARIRSKRRLLPGNTLYLALQSTTPAGTWAEEHCFTVALKLP